MLDKLLDYAQAQSDFVVDLQKRLTAIPAIGPDNKGDGESKKAAFLKKYLESMGLEVSEINAPDKRVSSGVRPNLAVRLPGKSSTTLDRKSVV